MTFEDPDFDRASPLCCRGGPGTRSRCRCRHQRIHHDQVAGRPGAHERRRPASADRLTSGVRDGSAKLALDLINTDTRAMWPLLPFSMPPDTTRFISSLLEVCGDPDPMTATLSLMTRASLLRAWGEFQERHPLIVAPIYTDLPFEPGKDLTVSEVAHIARGMRMAIAVNALGLPAVALPVGIRDGLPQAVQVIGPRYREDLCLDTAAAIEETVGILTPIDPI